MLSGIGTANDGRTNFARGTDGKLISSASAHREIILQGVGTSNRPIKRGEFILRSRGMGLKTFSSALRISNSRIIVHTYRKIITNTAYVRATGTNRISAWA